MRRAPFFTGHETNIFWNADSWLPDKYQEPHVICRSLSSSLTKGRFYGPHIMAFGAADKLSVDLIDNCQMYLGFICFETTRGSARERVLLMLVRIVLVASIDRHRESRLMVVTRLSQDDSEMICTVLGSLRRRGCRVLFALPELHVDDEAQTCFGLRVFSERNNALERIPVWLCPHLFDREGEDEDEKKRSQSCFIEPPAADAHTVSFSMPEGVHTCVFWDAEDYPLPRGLHLRRFYENIVSAVRARLPSSGDVSIYAYVVEEEEEEFEGDFEVDDGVPMTVRKAPADKYERLARMTMDFLLWSIDNPAEPPRRPQGPNLLVISKPLEDEVLGLRGILFSLQNRGHNVFLAMPAEKIPPPKAYVPLVSWEELSAAGRQKRNHEVGLSKEKKKKPTATALSVTLHNKFELLGSFAER